ncbi:MAG TPA: sigma-70 family RNA polymerase sigma factor, partial [Candidatus Hydrogenedentes bacterium]|nr:sigma-70 family RNA polymerase sigma factor [Candidatus Hydrogenedentota bacterium]
MELNEREYVRKALEGDKDAYGALVDAYQGMVFATALNITGDYADSEDVVQEAFLRAYQKLRALSDPAKFATWLHTLARRVALQFLEKKHRIPGATKAATLDGHAESAVESPAEAYARQELSRLLWAQVAALPPKTREAVLLYYMEGFSIKRAAAYLGINENAMKGRLRFGREKLREQLTATLEDELRQHRPSTDRRRAIIAALPAAPPPSTGLLASGTAKTLAAVFFSAKHVMAVAVLVVAVLAALLVAQRFRPRHSPTPVPTQRQETREVDKTRTDTDESVAATETTRDLEASAPALYSISGRAVEKATDRPVARLPLRLEKGGETVAEASTNLRGAFRFTDLADGQYALRAISDDPAIMRNYYLPKEQQTLSVRFSGRDVQGVLIEFERASFISGKVLDERGRPVPDVLLELVHQRMDTQRHTPAQPQVRSDANGNFVFPGVLPGFRYVISWQARGYVPGSLGSLGMVPGAPLENVIVQLVKGNGATLSGWVRNRDGQTVQGALVKALYTVNNELTSQAFCIAGSDGAFSFANLPPGSVDLSLDLYRRAGGRRKHFSVKPNEVIDDIEFVVDQKILDGYVSGVILDEQGQPITDGVVCAQPAANGTKAHIPVHRRYSLRDDIGETVPAENGRFRLTNLAPGTSVDILYRR